MKLGEALTLRRRQAEKLNDLRGRIKANAVAQEGDTPPERADHLIDEYKALSEEHGALVRRINVTNLTTATDKGPLITLLSQKEHLNRIRNVLVLAADAGAPGRAEFRYMRSEIKLVAQIDVAAIRQEIDSVQQQINDLDFEIQRVNWETDLP